MGKTHLAGQAILAQPFLGRSGGWMTAGVLALVLFGWGREASGQKDDARAAAQVLAIPDTVLAPEWMEIRKELQVESKDTFGVFHDFRFSDRVEESGIEFLHRIVDDSGKHWKPVHYDHGNGIAAADVNGDGLEDIYFLNQIGANQLWKNLGRGRFRDMTEIAGVGVADRISVAASFADIDNDGDADLFVTTVRQGNDEYYENVEGRKFVKKSRELFPKTPWGSMGIQVFDFDNDGRMDIFLTDMHSDMSEAIPPLFEKLKSNMQWTPSRLAVPKEQSIYGNAFFLNQGQGQFQEVSDKIGAENYWPWGLSAGDLNADGYIDAFIASSMNYPFRYGINSILLNDQGKSFRDSEFILGVEPRRGNRTAGPWFNLDCDGVDKNHSACQGRSGRFVVWAALGTRSSVIFDLDGDGDQDIVTNEFNSEPMVLVSDLAERKPISYLKVKLQGERSNRDGLGARVTLQTEARSYTRVHDGKSGYLSQSRLPLYFGLGNASLVERIEVIWPSGERQVILGPIRANQQLEVKEPDGPGSGSE